MLFAIWLRNLHSTITSSRRGRKRGIAGRSLGLLRLEERTVPTVTAVNEAFTTMPNTPMTLDVLGPAMAASTEPAVQASVGTVSPSGPTLTQNADGTFAFTSAATGTFTFQYTVAGKQQGVTAGDGATDDVFGFSVAISGTTAVVGAYRHKVGSNSGQGAAYVYTLSDSSWTLQQELTAADGTANAQFGNSVAVSGDTLVIGSDNRQVGSNSSQGAAYVYARSGTTWTQQVELTAADGGAFNYFGNSVAISGNTLAIGAYGHTVGSNINSAQGTVYLYTRSGTTWISQAELTGSDSLGNDQFGVITLA